MRWKWKWKKKQQPKEGDTRIMERFLLFPKLLDDEWRWLENAQIDQEYKVMGLGSDWRLRWVDLGWNTFHDEPMG